jgi:hypothetical protein
MLNILFDEELRKSREESHLQPGTCSYPAWICHQLPVATDDLGQMWRELSAPSLSQSLLWKSKATISPQHPPSAFYYYYYYYYSLSHPETKLLLHPVLLRYSLLAPPFPKQSSAPWTYPSQHFAQPKNPL